VKLMFDTTDLLGRRNWSERMWVEVLAVKRRHIVGVLADDPLGIPRLDFGDQVKFKREHIIDILWEPSQVRESELAAGDQEHHNIAPVHEGCNGHGYPGHPELPSPPEALEGT
jgi:hypothetical protein